MENTAIGKIIDNVIKEIEQKRNQNRITGIATGFDALDKLSGGLKKGEVIVVGGRPGMGKTAFGISLAKNITASYGIGTAIISLELSAKQMAERVIGNELQIPLSKFNQGEIWIDDEFTELVQGGSRLNHLPLFIDDTRNINLISLFEKCWMYKHYHNVQCIIIDYFQLMATNKNLNKGNEGELALILSNIKQLAKDLDISIVVLSQLSCTVDKRKNKRPLLCDFKNIVEIEQIVNKVFFLYRSEYYGDTNDNNPYSNRGAAELIVVDTQSKTSVNIPLQFRGEFSLFENWSELN